MTTTDPNKPDPNAKPSKPDEGNGGRGDTRPQRKPRLQVSASCRYYTAPANGGDTLIENAATVTKLHADGTADLFVMFAEKEPARVKRVKEAEGPELGTFRL